VISDKQHRELAKPQPADGGIDHRVPISYLVRDRRRDALFRYTIAYLPPDVHWLVNTMTRRGYAARVACAIAV
jgi:hypothetical protein